MRAKSVIIGHYRGVHLLIKVATFKNILKFYDKKYFMNQYGSNYELLWPYGELRWGPHNNWNGVSLRIIVKNL